MTTVHQSGREVGDPPRSFLDQEREHYTFTNGWWMQRATERPFFWMLYDASGVFIDRDQYRHDLMPRHNLSIDTHVWGAE